MVVMFEENKNSGYWTKWKVGDKEMAYATVDLWMDNFELTEVYNLAIMSDEKWKSISQDLNPDKYF